ncbi:MAG: sulfur carrier protein ThiS [Lachnospiraceae bacterium]|nr:sulfur carrier protein ThiS [Lachnospiraceae bacterium]
MQLNGEEKTGYDGVSVEEMIQREGFNRARIAVEINGRIVSKAEYSSVCVHSGDVIEVVSFVGGG